MSTPYRTPPQAPPSFDATSTSLVSDADQLVLTTAKVWDTIISNVSPADASFESVFLPIILDENKKAETLRRICFYASTHPTKELRDASQKASRIFADAETELALRDGILSLTEAVIERIREDDKIDAASRYYVKKFHQNLISKGGALHGEDKTRFEEIQKRLNQLLRMCIDNFNSDVSGIWLSRDELAGVPEDVFTRLRTSEDGMLWLSFKAPDLTPTLRYATKPETRKKVHSGNQNRMNVNVPFVQEIVLLRDEAARLLGYSNHAALKTSGRMVQNPNVVNEFLGDLCKQLIPRGIEEVATMQALKKADVAQAGQDPEQSDFFFWDYHFYSNIVKETSKSINHIKVSEYYALEVVLPRLQEIYEQMFGIRFELLSAVGEKGSQLLWHEDIIRYAVWNDEHDDEDFLGYLYYDIFPRNGKYTHAGHYNLLPGFVRPDGTRHYPASVLVLNFAKGLPTKPTLLKHEEIRRLFHELGHAMQNLLSRTCYASQHGTKVDRDWLEAPCMMLENFFWTPRHMKELALHYSHISPAYEKIWRLSLIKAEQEKPLPDQLDDKTIQSLIDTRQNNTALVNLAKLNHSTYDMIVHSPASHEELKSMDLVKTWNDNQERLISMKHGDEQGNGHATFRGLVGSYDAGYYTYLLGQVYSFDMFYTAFKADTMNRRRTKVQISSTSAWWQSGRNEDFDRLSGKKAKHQGLF